MKINEVRIEGTGKVVKNEPSADALGVVVKDRKRGYVLTYINDKLILINPKKLYMSILFCTFASRKMRCLTG